MEIREILDLAMFGAACILLLAGFPVAFTLAGTGLLFATIGHFFGVFDFSLFGALPSRIFGNSMWNEVLLAVPLFVFMGVTLERSKVAEELLDSMGMLFGSLRGGLGISVSVVGALLAASTGIVGATVVTMGLLSLPTMLRRGYDPSLACGSICAAGTLGQIIPPSIVLVILGEQISNAYVDAQRAAGNWSPEPVSVGDLFAGALIPGLVLVGFYILYQILIAILRPETSPPLPKEEIQAENMTRRIFKALLPPVILIVSVLGSILAGVATPTEAASVGAVGALLLAGLRLAKKPSLAIYAAGLGLIVMLIATNMLDLRVSRDVIGSFDMAGIVVSGIAAVALAWGLLVALWRVHQSQVLGDVCRSTMQISSMVFVILIGASVFSLVFRGLGGDDTVHELLNDLPGGVWGAVFAVMLVMFVLGFFLDFIEITFVVVPIVAPVLLQMDPNMSPVWLGVMMALNLQTSFLTPPFGFSLFYLRGVAPETVTTGHIYKGALPFVAIQIVALGLLAAFPIAATWLPSIIFG
ncbi:MAG: TRAP transporter large permease [Magnetospiraceae bacterium]